MGVARAQSTQSRACVERDTSGMNNPRAFVDSLLSPPIPLCCREQRAGPLGGSASSQHSRGCTCEASLHGSASTCALRARNNLRHVTTHVHAARNARVTRRSTRRATRRATRRVPQHATRRVTQHVTRRVPTRFSSRCPRRRPSSAPAWREGAEHTEPAVIT